MPSPDALPSYSNRELGRTGETRRRAQRFPGADSKETIRTIAKPNMHPFILATWAAALLAACNDKNEAAEDKLERAAETSATVAGPLPAALGLSEAQLLEADLVGADGKELGDVAQVLRDADDKVEIGRAHV